MSETQASDLAQVIRILVEYMNGKGQLPRLDKFILLDLYQQAMMKVFNINQIVDWDKVIKLSIHAPPIERPLWLHALAEISKINNKTEIVSQQFKKKPLLGSE